MESHSGLERFTLIGFGEIGIADKERDLFAVISILGWWYIVDFSNSAASKGDIGGYCQTGSEIGPKLGGR